MRHRSRSILSSCTQTNGRKFRFRHSVPSGTDDRPYPRDGLWVPGRYRKIIHSEFHYADH